MESEPESYLQNYPKQISYKRIKEIENQMEKCICKIKYGKNQQATGFFTKILIPKLNKKVKVLMICNHSHEEKLLGNETFYLDIKSEKEIKKINLNGRKYYTNESEYDITIIELKEDDNINNFLELDDEFNNSKYIGETLYILHYPSGELSVSFGILNNICLDKPQTFLHLCCTLPGSSGGAIIKEDNKLIGIHKEGSKNYNIGTFLNYPIKEFIQENYENYDIDNIDIEVDVSQKVFDLSKRNIGNKGLEIISDKKLNNLEQLKLGFNNINNIKPLINVNLNNLQYLYLNDNKISDVKPLENKNLSKLIILNLMKNNISDINVLKTIKFNELNELYLNNNDLKDIKALEKVILPKIEILDLNSNKISDINILSKVKFETLKELYLSKNKISDITVFQNVKFPNLEYLSLQQNEISNINVLSKVNFPTLKKLLLDDNKILDLKVLSQINLEKIPKLHTLSLLNNNIDKQKNYSYISKMDGKINI